MFREVTEISDDSVIKLTIKQPLNSGKENGKHEYTELQQTVSQ
jgi:hypothetical protein